MMALDPEVGRTRHDDCCTLSVEHALPRSDVDVFSAKADAGAVTIRHRSTEPRLDEKAPSEEVDSFDKVVICSGVLSRDLAHKTERSIRMTLSLAFVAPPICRGGDRGTPAAWFSRQAS